MRCIFQRFLAAFSQFSRKFPGRCEEKAKFGWKSRRIRDYSGRFGKHPKSLENRLPKRHGGSNPSSCANKNGLLLVGRPIFIATVRGSRIRSPSELARRGVRIWAVERVKLACKRQGEKSSSKTNTPLPSLLYKLEFDAPSNWKLFIKPF